MELPFTSQWSWDNSNCSAVQSCYAQWGLESNLASAVLIMFCLVPCFRQRGVLSWPHFILYLHLESKAPNALL